MDNDAVGHPDLTGEFVAELLDQVEYPGNVEEVAAVSTEQICFVRRDWDELTHFRLEYFDMGDCRSIEYHDETVWYRIVLAIACFAVAAAIAVTVAAGLPDISERDAPLIIAVIAFATFGVRFVTSTHRHVIHFEMPDETLSWGSPPIDFKSKAQAAQAVREFARTRGILRTSGGK